MKKPKTQKEKKITNRRGKKAHGESDKSRYEWIDPKMWGNYYKSKKRQGKGTKSQKMMDFVWRQKVAKKYENEQITFYRPLGISIW